MSNKMSFSWKNIYGDFKTMPKVCIDVGMGHKIKDNAFGKHRGKYLCGCLRSNHQP